MVGIAGVPGSGKSTFCSAIAARLPQAVILPADGYHLPRSRLDAESLRRRGALHTFDADAFHADMQSLRRDHCGNFPAFDHAEQDPRHGAIHVAADAPLVIVEGIYVLMRSWRSEHLFDLRVFLDCDLDEMVDRLTVRHVECGLAATPQAGRERTATSDRANADLILIDGCRERADLILPSGSR